MSSDNYMNDERAESIAGFIAGLEILSKYHKDGLKAKYAFGGEHDIVHIWLCTLDDCPEQSDDGQMLTALGFHADDELHQWGYFT